MDVLVLRACWPLAALVLGRLLALVAFAVLARKTRSYDDDEIHGDSSHARRAILPAYRPFLLGMLVAQGQRELAKVREILFGFSSVLALRRVRCHGPRP